MRFLTISGKAASGKSSMLNILAKDAGRPVFSAQEMQDFLRLMKKGGSVVQLETETFVDEVTPALKKQIEALGKDYSNDYVVVMAIPA